MFFIKNYRKLYSYIYTQHKGKPLVRNLTYCVNLIILTIGFSLSIFLPSGYGRICFLFSVFVLLIILGRQESQEILFHSEFKVGFLGRGNNSQKMATSLVTSVAEDKF